MTDVARPREVGARSASARGHGRGARAPTAGTTLALLFGGLLLYLAFGKGFAYAGWPPVFVGEVLLVVVVVGACSTTVRLPRHPASGLIVILMAIAAVQAVVDRLVGVAPVLETVRGLAPIYYALYAFGTYSLLRAFEHRAGREHVLATVRSATTRFAPVVVGLSLLLAGLLLIEPTNLPSWPGSGVPILLTKSGDIAVALTLLLPILIARRSDDRPVPPRVILAAWFAAAVLISFRSRGALLALVVGLVVARPNPVRIAKVLLGGLAVVLVLYVTGLRVEVSGREISYDAVGDAAASVLGGGPEDQIGSNYLDTTNWRADWWSSIWDDVADERMLLHGRGWGDNLAIRHGVIASIGGDDPRVLRLPHDVFFSLAGRAGLVFAIGFLLVPVLTIVRTFRGDTGRRTPVTVQAARGALAAAVTTGLTDIYLESPQGGIVYWTLSGFLWWAVAHPLPSRDPAS